MGDKIQKFELKGNFEKAERKREKLHNIYNNNLIRIKKPFGSWFPKAIKIVGAKYYDEISIVLFYQYAEPLWDKYIKKEAIEICVNIGINLNLGGRIRISREGFNATVSGYKSSLVKFIERLKSFNEAFKNTDFKFINKLPSDKAFKDLDIFPVQEIVHYGISPEIANNISNLKGEHLNAKQFH